LSNKAIDLFNEINNPDEVIINLLFNACAQLGTVEALNLVKRISKEIPKSFHSNHRLSTSLFDALIKCGDCSNAENLFSKTQKSVMDYGNLMNGFNKENNPSKTLNLFNQMKIDGVEADLIIYLSVLKALSEIGDYSQSESIDKQIPHSFLVDNQIQNVLIDMWVS
jgi:pentatricopeptide repeat protein